MERDEVNYAAIDLGTNNCRLLIARPTRRGFYVLDAFSRVSRLGEGVGSSGMLSEDAIQRTLDALKICAAKLARHEVQRSRFVATQACRMAANGPAFVARVRRELGLDLEILSEEQEARLAVAGSAALIDDHADLALVFDIGGGSSEVIWLDFGQSGGPGGRPPRRGQAQDHIVAWTSLPVGVATLAERFGGRHVTCDVFEAMVAAVIELIRPFEARHRFRELMAGRKVNLLGTSGTVTTVAGIQLRLPKYDRRKVDGCWLETEHVRDVTNGLLGQSYEQRVAEPCVGRDRADLVLAGCAILEALLRVWPTDRLRVADRGLREGLLMGMMTEDGHYRTRRRRFNRRRG